MKQYQIRIVSVEKWNEDLTGMITVEKRFVDIGDVADIYIPETVFDGEKFIPVDDNTDLQLEWHFHHAPPAPATGMATGCIVARDRARRDTDIGHNISAGLYCRIDGDMLVVEDADGKKMKNMNIKTSAAS